MVQQLQLLMFFEICICYVAYVAMGQGHWPYSKACMAGGLMNPVSLLLALCVCLFVGLFLQPVTSNLC